MFASQVTNHVGSGATLDLPPGNTELKEASVPGCVVDSVKSSYQYNDSDSSGALRPVLSQLTACFTLSTESTDELKAQGSLHSSSVALWEDSYSFKYPVQSHPSTQTWACARPVSLSATNLFNRRGQKQITCAHCKGHF